jgi:uridine kinase
VFHIDDFFLRKVQRTKQRLEKPGGNVDYERFLEEALLPLKSKNRFSYCPYDAHTWTFKEAVTVTLLPINIIEGSYSCHPALYKYYDVTIFLDIDKEEQIKRITYRNGKEILEVFKEKWIPLEEAYFSTYNIKEHCQLHFQIEDK